MSRERPERAELLASLALAGRQLSTATIMFHQAIAERLGLHATDHKCLDLLVLKGAMTAGALADLTGLTTGAITGVIDRLEKGGFVRREEDPEDRRRVIVAVVAERCQGVGALFSSLVARMGGVCARYSDEELAIILDFQKQAQEGLHQATLELRQDPPAGGKQAEKKRGRRGAG